MDIAIVQQIQEGSIDRAVKSILATRQGVRSSLSSYISNIPRHLEFEDIYYDSILIFIRNVQAGKFELRGNHSIRNFITQICKRKIQNSIRDNRVTAAKDIEHVILSDDTPNSYHQMEDSEKEHYFQLLLAESVPESCGKIIELRYFEKERHDKIAELLGLKNANSSKVKLSDCIKKIRKYFHEKIPPHIMDLILDY